MGQPNRTDLLRGTLEMIILKLIDREPDHGHGLVKRIGQELGDEFLVDHGSLYPALYRMESRGLITSTWSATPQRRRAKYYEITTQGRTRLERDVRDWNHFVATVRRFMESGRDRQVAVLRFAGASFA